MNKTMIRAAVENCKSFKKKQFQEKDPAVKAYQKVRPKYLVELLAATRGPAKRPARDLLESMAATAWSIKATLHEGGRADNENPDWRPHFTVKVGNNRARHLRCKVTRGRIFIIEIT